MKASTTSSKPFIPHPVAQDSFVHGVIVDVTDPELKTGGEWGDKWKCAVIIESELKNADGEHFTIRRSGLTVKKEDNGTFSLFKGGKVKAAFEKFLNSIGIEQTPEFDTEHLIGYPVKFMVEHQKDKTDPEKVYANLSLIRHDPDGKMKPSGKYVRVKDRNKEGGSNQSTPATSPRTQYNPVSATPAEPDDAWTRTKVHVGQFAGTEVGDLPNEEAIDNLLTHWWPTVSAKPLADDRRLHPALLRAKQEFEKMRQDTTNQPPSF